MSNVIRAVFSGGARSVVTEAQYMWSKGQILLIEGLDLPTAFRVYFSSKKKGKGVSKPVLGQYNVCLIPDEYFEKNKNIKAWVMVVGEDHREIEYDIEIPIIDTSKTEDEDPDSSEVSIVDQAINALNDAVQTVTDATEKIENMTVSSETLPEGSDATVTKTEEEGVVNLNFGIPKGDTGEQGIQGIQGEKGDSARYLNVDTYNLVIPVDGYNKTGRAVSCHCNFFAKDGTETLTITNLQGMPSISFDDNTSLSPVIDIDTYAGYNGFGYIITGEFIDKAITTVSHSFDVYITASNIDGTKTYYFKFRCSLTFVRSGKDGEVTLADFDVIENRINDAIDRIDTISFSINNKGELIYSIEGSGV